MTPEQTDPTCASGSEHGSRALEEYEAKPPSPIAGVCGHRDSTEESV